jgi:hypothetical protein
MDIFKLNRTFWDFAFNNPEKIKPNHCAIYYFALEHCNRLGWKQKFGFPTSMVLEATGIKSYSVYKKAFDEIVSYGFFEVIEYSKNQYSSNIIALKENDKALDKALDKAFIKHDTKQSESTIQSIDSIDKPIYNKQETINKENINTPLAFSFYNSLVNYGFNKDLVSDWLKVRNTKKLTNTETAFKKFIIEVEKTNLDKNKVLEECVSNSWGGFKNEWINKTTTKNQEYDIDELRKQFPDL